MIRLRVENLSAVMSDMKEHDKRTYNAITKGLRAAGKPVADDAASLYPSTSNLRNWGSWNATGTGKNGEGRNLAYDASKVKASIAPTTRNSRVGMYRKNWLAIEVKDAAGSIFHTAGYGEGRYRYKGKRGLSFRQNMRDKNPRPRPLWTAVERADVEIQRQVEALMKRVDDWFTGRNGR